MSAKENFSVVLCYARHRDIVASLNQEDGLLMTAGTQDVDRHAAPAGRPAGRLTTRAGWWQAGRYTTSPTRKPEVSRPEVRCGGVEIDESI